MVEPRHLGFTLAGFRLPHVDEKAEANYSLKDVWNLSVKVEKPFDVLVHL